MPYLIDADVLQLTAAARATTQTPEHEWTALSNYGDVVLI